MKEVKNNIVRFWIEDSILYNEFISPFDLSVENAKSIIDLRHQISNGEKQYWCFNMKNIKTMPKDGRDYTDNNGQEFLYATAAIVNSHLTQFIFNIFLKVKKPKVPFRAFTKKEDAISWLIEFKQKE